MADADKPLVIGISGSSGCGKSTLAARLADHYYDDHSGSSWIVHADQFFVPVDEMPVYQSPASDLCDPNWEAPCCVDYEALEAEVEARVAAAAAAAAPIVVCEGFMLYGVDDDGWGDAGRVSELRSAVLADAPPGAGTDDGNPADEHAYGRVPAGLADRFDVCLFLRVSRDEAFQRRLNRKKRSQASRDRFKKYFYHLVWPHHLAHTHPGLTGYLDDWEPPERMTVIEADHNDADAVLELALSAINAHEANG